MVVDPQTLDLLGDPETHVRLELAGDCLINPASGRRYPVHDGVPALLQDVSGPNREYQAMYDRLEPGYDIAERLYRWVSRKPDYRLEYLRELEIAAGARIPEVSVGTAPTCAIFARRSRSSASICLGACCVDAAAT